MKKAVFFLAIMFSVCMFSQETEPTLEKVGKMVKATYFHDNGEVSQTGYMLKGKLHGDWLMFDTNGKKMAAGKYDNGKKTGKWFFWKEDILREVDFSDNRIVNVKDWSQSEVVSVNK